MDRQHAMEPQPAHRPAAHAHARPFRAPSLARNDWTGLQRAVGNQTAWRLLRQNSTAQWPAADASIPAPRAPNEPGDSYEQEADRVAEQVMLQPVHAGVGSAPARIQRLAGQTTGEAEAPASVGRVLADQGRALEPALRQDMEHRFGHDFGRVRLHTDAAAEQSARDVNASAYTVGRDIVFAAGRFAPATQQGRRLLAHELTHVVQQSGAGNATDAGQSRLFRQPAEAHYPTEEEQHNIEELLRRNRKTTTVVTTPTGEQVTVKGRKLSPDQVTELAARLQAPFLETLDSMDRRSSETTGGLDEKEALEVVKSAREALLERFGTYTTRTATLTLDPKTTPQQRKAAGQVLIIFGDPDAAAALARTIIETHCEKCASELNDLEEDSKDAVVDAMKTAALQSHGDQLRRVARKVVPGKHSEEAKITLRLTERAAFFHTAVHELVHQLAHPAFHAAFVDERNVIEGFTDYFAHQIYGGDVDPGYAKMVEKIQGVRAAMRGPFHLVSDQPAEESLRQAYFGGHLEYIGWVANSAEEQAAVDAAHAQLKESSKQWDAATAREWAAVYRTQAQAQQAASSNVLQVGLFFAQKSSDTIAVRYTRVIARTEPFAKGQLFLEGQVLASPSTNPGALGLSLGIGGEYQEPHFYAGGGVRFIGTTLPGTGTNRLDVSPFVGAGFRPWQTIRVGAEGFALLPVTGQDKALGAGVTVGVEF